MQIQMLESLLVGYVITTALFCWQKAQVFTYMYIYPKAMLLHSVTLR